MGASKTTKSMKILVLESFRLYSINIHSILKQSNYGTTYPKLLIPSHL